MANWLLLVAAASGTIAILTILFGAPNIISISQGIDRLGNIYSYNPSILLQQHGCHSKANAISNSNFLYSMLPDMLPSSPSNWTYYLNCITGGQDEKQFIYTL